MLTHTSTYHATFLAENMTDEEVCRNLINGIGRPMDRAGKRSSGYVLLVESTLLLATIRDSGVKGKQWKVVINLAFDQKPYARSSYIPGIEVHTSAEAILSKTDRLKLLRDKIRGRDLMVKYNRLDRYI